MSENLFTVLGLVPGPADDAKIVAAYERRLAECRRRIRDENQRAAREEGLIYAYAVLRDPARREAYLRRHVPTVRIVKPATPPPAPETVPDSEPHGKNKPDAIRRLCETIDAAMMGGAIDDPHRRAVHSRAHLLGVTPFEAELLMATAIERHRRRTAGETETDSAPRPNNLSRIIATCLTIIVLAIFLYSRL